MKHGYYYYDRERFLAEPKIPVTVMADNEKIFLAIAKEMAEEVKRKNACSEHTVFICPVGPVGQYPYFVDLVNREKISLKNVWFINMDEYLTDDMEWIPKEDILSFRGFMDTNVYSKIQPQLLMPPQQRVFPDPNNPQEVGELIRRLGGVDICFGGIGINGHLAFNEAQDDLSVEEFLNLHTRVLKISSETKTANAIGNLNGAIDDMPTYCVTIGMYEIFHSKKVRLACFRDWHRSVVRHAAYGEVSAHFPATMMQMHPDVLLRTTEFVANLPKDA